MGHNSVIYLQLMRSHSAKASKRTIKWTIADFSEEIRGGFITSPSFFDKTGQWLVHISHMSSLKVGRVKKKYLKLLTLLLWFTFLFSFMSLIILTSWEEEERWKQEKVLSPFCFLSSSSSRFDEFFKKSRWAVAYLI